MLLLGIAVAASVSCSSRDSASLAERRPASASAVSERVSTDASAGLAATELQGFSPAARRAAAPPRALRASKESGCNKSLPGGVQAGKTALRSVSSGEMKRSYRLHLPSKATTTKRLPVVLNFHGRSSTAIDQEILSGLVSISDRESFILVSPEGTGSPTGWSAGATPTGPVDDVRFVSDLLDTIEREFCVDTARVFATGFSNGAFMSSKLACALPERIAAIAVVGGVHFPGEACPARMPVLAIHGTADSIVPMTGGSVRAWRYPGVPAAMAEWAATNGCGTTAAIIELNPGVTLQAFPGCNVATELVMVNGGGHAWPGGPGTSAADPVGSFSAAEMIWAFFAASQL